MKKFYFAILLAAALGLSGYVSLGNNVFTTTQVSFRAINFTSAASEGLITLTPQRDFVDGSTGNTFAPNAKSILKLQSLCVMSQNAAGAAQGVIVRLRVNPTGAALVNSPVALSVGAGTTVATTNVTGTTCASLGDGLELFSTAQLALTQIGTANAGNDVVLSGYERVQQ